MTRPFLVFVLLITLMATISCQTFSYGPPSSSRSRNAARADSTQTFESVGIRPEKKDPMGTILLIGLGIAAGAATAALVPLALGGRL